MFVDGQLILEERYKVLKKLGGGAFGEIYKSKYLISLIIIIFNLIHPFNSIVEKLKTKEILAAKVVSYSKQK